MNQKATREQNDISIIGTLPQRLQRKIAEEFGQSGSNTKADIKENGRSVQQAAKAQSECSASVPRAKGVMSPSSKRSLPSSNSCTTVAVASEAPVVRSSCDAAQAFDVVGVPGILHVDASVNVEKVVRPLHVMARSKCYKVPVRLKRREAPANLSPVHLPQITTTTLPDWFSASNVQTYAKDLKEGYDFLVMLMQQDGILQHWEKFCTTRSDFQHVFQQLLLYQLKFCCEQKVDTFFWKFIFYNIREHLKKFPLPQASKCILLLIDDGLYFYKNLLSEFKAKYLTYSTGVHGSESRSGQRYETIAKVMAQKLLICLGDLSRYKAKQLRANEFAEATRYYLEAQRLIPTNGIPYNQLAVVAIHERKKFDAVYFHMRSLMSSNAIGSAKESLLVLCDEIRKKYEETEAKNSPVHQNHHTNGYTRSMRTEVWIGPDGVRRIHSANINRNKATQSEERRLNSMTAEELLRHFTSLYLYVIGKLYTGIGMESIQEHQRKLLIHLDMLLKDTNLAITRSRMLKYVALNIFVVENNIQTASRREIRYHAFNFCNQMFGLILRKCNQLLLQHLYDSRAEQDKKSFVSLNTTLQYIKIYTDWLRTSIGVWEPIRSEDHIFIDCWAELERLFTSIKEALSDDHANTDHLENALLEEDKFLNGFTPLGPVTGSKQVSEMEQFYIRLHKISKFRQFYEENRTHLDMLDERHLMLQDLNIALHHAEDSENVPDQNCQVEMQTSPLVNGDNTQLLHLAKLKKELEAISNVKKIYNAKYEKILKYVDPKLCIEVRPKFLMPDTNCFIDCVEELERLAKEFNNFTLVVPLTVVKELDGLSKGIKAELNERSFKQQRIHHFDDVSTRAMKSLDFIRRAKYTLRCATTKGSFINATLFGLVEEENMSNDDKILSTALALSKTMSSETVRDGKCLIQTELVLITTDRNLRVKALSRNLAVSELSEFLLWAKNCNA